MTLTKGFEKFAAVLLLAITAAIYAGSAGVVPLLDDADSSYAEVAREMNARGDWMTPYMNGVRYLEKPPLFYWMIASSYKLLRMENAFSARLPIAIAVMALVYTTFLIGRRLYGWREGFTGGLALATSLGFFLFTRIILPEAILTFLISFIILFFVRWVQDGQKRSDLLFMYFGAGLAILAKGLIGFLFPAGIIFFILVFSGRWKDIFRLVSLPGILLMLAVAVPWHIVVGTRNPGFYWFYFINEHVLRFLGKRFPRDYGTVPLIPFWLLHLVWIFPWSLYFITVLKPSRFRSLLNENKLGALVALSWILTILMFFSFSSRLEYYTVPAFPGFALLAGRQFIQQWDEKRKTIGYILTGLGVTFGVVLTAVAVIVSAYASEGWLKLNDNPDLYRYFFGHLFDLTPESLLALRLPMIVAAGAFALLFPIHVFVKKIEVKAISLAVAVGVFFVAANIAFLVFSPRLTSKGIADKIARDYGANADVIIDGEFSEAASIVFYLRRPVVLVNGRTTTLEYGSRYPDNPPVFIDTPEMKRRWDDKTHQIVLVSYQSKMEQLGKTIDLKSGRELLQYGDKMLLTNLK